MDVYDEMLQKLEKTDPEGIKQTEVQYEQLMTLSQKEAAEEYLKLLFGFAQDFSEENITALSYDTGESSEQLLKMLKSTSLLRIERLMKTAEINFAPLEELTRRYDTFTLAKAANELHTYQDNIVAIAVADDLVLCHLDYVQNRVDINVGLEKLYNALGIYVQVNMAVKSGVAAEYQGNLEIIEAVTKEMILTMCKMILCNNENAAKQYIRLIKMAYDIELQYGLPRNSDPETDKLLDIKDNYPYRAAWQEWDSIPLHDQKNLQPITAAGILRPRLYPDGK